VFRIQIRPAGGVTYITTHPITRSWFVQLHYSAELLSYLLYSITG